MGEGRDKSEGESQCYSEGSGGGQAREMNKSNAVRRVAVDTAAKIRAIANIQGAKRERAEAESEMKERRRRR